MAYKLAAWSVLLLLLLAACGVEGMKLSSPAFEDAGRIPSKYTCKGDDISPPLRVQGIPRDAKSLAIIVDDPDAPGKTWVHWLVWNLPLGDVPEGSLAQGAVQGTNDFGDASWGGPCPPSGVHRYVFQVFALDTLLQIGPGSERRELESAMQGHVIAKAELVGRFGA